MSAHMRRAPHSYGAAGFTCQAWGTGCNGDGANGANNCPRWGAPYLHTSHFTGDSVNRNGQGLPCFFGNAVGACTSHFCIGFGL
jgi:hypothetical protein